MKLHRDWRAFVYSGEWDVDATNFDFPPADEPMDRYSVLEDPSEEDAKLIAAAPAMLEILKSFSSETEAVGEIRFHKIQEIIKEL